MSTDWIDAAAAEAVPEGESLAAVVDGREIALHRLDGELFATDLYCTHGHARLCDGFIEADGSIECPLHQGRFDIRSGKALCEPLERDLGVHDARVDGGRVWVRLKPVS